MGLIDQFLSVSHIHFPVKRFVCDPYVDGIFTRISVCVFVESVVRRRICIDTPLYTGVGSSFSFDVLLLVCLATCLVSYVFHVVGGAEY